MNEMDNIFMNNLNVRLPFTNLLVMMLYQAIYAAPRSNCALRQSQVGSQPEDFLSGSTPPQFHPQDLLKQLICPGCSTGKNDGENHPHPRIPTLSPFLLVKLSEIDYVAK